jgi:hypothetical protein
MTRFECVQFLRRGANRRSVHNEIDFGAHLRDFLPRFSPDARLGTHCQFNRQSLGFVNRPIQQDQARHVEVSQVTSRCLTCSTTRSSQRDPQ